MALADLNPRSTLKFLVTGNSTAAAGRLVTIDIAATATAGVTVLKQYTGATDLPIGVIVVGAASDSGSYPGYATSFEIYDTLIGCFDGAIAGTGGVTAGDSVAGENGGAFVTTASPSAGEYIVGYALTDAAAGQQFTIKFNVTQF